MEPRSSQLVLDKLTSLVAGAAGAERQYWMPDDISVGVVVVVEVLLQGAVPHQCAGGVLRLHLQVHHSPP